MFSFFLQKFELTENKNQTYSKSRKIDAFGLEICFCHNPFDDMSKKALWVEQCMEVKIIGEKVDGQSRNLRIFVGAKS